MDKKVPFHFDAHFIESAFHPTDDPHLQFGRVRTFYKYSNRNGSFITDEYAEKLGPSAYMKPIFGYYCHEQNDFLGHEGPQKVKAYGFVLPNSLAWEDHLDDDGITRNYATYDVLVWAEYWEEAKTIFQKAQSMEIDSKTVRGEWRIMGDSNFEEYVYSEGVMAGLCILGDMKTPCFEGAAFFSMDDDSYVKFTQAIKHYYSNGGKDAMNVKVAGLEHECFEEIWNALNPNFNEEGAYSINLIPCEITEEHIFALNCENAGVVNKYSYSFNEEGKLVIAEEFEVENYKVQVENYKEQIAAFEATRSEMDTKLTDALNTYVALKDQYDTLMADKETLQGQFEALQEQFNALQADLESKQQEIATKQEEFNAQAATLVEKDATISQQSEVIADYEKKEKDAVINKFAACMPADTLQTIIDKKDSLTIKELNTELALEYTKFSMAKEQKQDIHIPQSPAEESALFKILKNYKK